jgi:hypothetical protein
MFFYWKILFSDVQVLEHIGMKAIRGTIWKNLGAKYEFGSTRLVESNKIVCWKSFAAKQIRFAESVQRIDEIMARTRGKSTPASTPKKESDSSATPAPSQNSTPPTRYFDPVKLRNIMDSKDPEVLIPNLFSIYSA